MSTLDNLRREAKQWLKALRSQDPSARARFAKAWPEAPAAPTLRDVQHALAREHGFESWIVFKAAVTMGGSRPAPELPPLDHEAAVEAFVAAACWEHHTHGANAYASQANAAMRLLAHHPGLADRDLTTAVICGNLAGVARQLANGPALATTKAGPRGWEPLLYLAFARLPLPALEQNAVAIARLLLDRGADPNAYYMAGSAKYSVLVGVAGEGEQDAPRDQSYKQALYRVLLERGAGPYDIQVLYNTHFSADMLWWLQLTYEHDMARGDVSAWQDPAWKMLDMGGYGPGSYFVLRVAVDKNNVELARWALEHGADPSVMTSTHPKFKPRQTLYQQAWFQGRTEIAELLAQYGASTLVDGVLKGESVFLQACLRGDLARVRALAGEHPEYLQSAAAIRAAAEADRVEVVELLLDLGMPIEIENEQKQRPLHMAAGANALRVAKLLIDRGAEIDPRETQWGSTPLGFAVYGNRREMIQLLVPLTRSVWHLAWLGEVNRLRDVLHAEPERAKEVTSNGGTPLMWLPDDDEKAAQVVDLLLEHGADPTVRTKHDRMTAAEYARQRGLETAARKLAALAPLAPVTPSGPALQKFENLAKDLVVAFESGEPRAIERLVAHFGGHADWERVREAARYQLRTAPESEVPGGYFALPQARLVIARLAGFRNWDQLLSVLGPQHPPSTTMSVPPKYVPDLGPGMIQPVEMAAGFRVKMRDGSYTTTTQVWNTLTAARNGDMERVMELANATPGLVLCDYNYMPPLHLAVREGHAGMVTFFADCGAANPNHVTYPYRETLITVARDRGYEEIAKVLERRYAEEDHQRKEEEGGEIEYERDDERERFQRLVNNDAIAEVQELLARRPELALDEFASWSEGILSMPANRGNRQMLELLLQHGAHVPQVTKWGAWYYFKHYDIAAFLIERGMSPHHMNCHHTTLLHDMAYTGDVRKAALLLDHGADIDAIDEEFRSTPLGVAARFGKREMVEFLLDRGANPNASGAPWATPLEWARKKGHADIESQLRAAGASTAPRRRAARTDSPQGEPPTPKWTSERSLGVRPDMAAIEREVEAEGGGARGRQMVADAYGAGTWERLATAVRLVDAIWRDELDVVREIIDANPRLLHEHALIRTNSNWGPPMSYAANLGRNRIIRFLHERGATDIDSAMDRAVLQGQLDTARMLYQMGATPPDRQSLDGPAETLNAEGMALLVELGVELNADTAPVEMVLGTYCRNPLGKHQILEMFVRHGVPLLDTAPMAVHRGRLDLLEKHLRRDPQLFSRTFTHKQMFPPELGCYDDESRVLVGTPLGGSGLLNMCIEYDELELATWMIAQGADVNLRARVDADGFGGHTPLFNTVVSLGGGRSRHGEFAKLLLDHGANPSVRATLRKMMRDSEDDSLHEYHNVTPLEWGERFHIRSIVNEIALDVIRKRSRPDL